jgi:hypothetical protein
MEYRPDLSLGCFGDAALAKICDCLSPVDGRPSIILPAVVSKR